MLLQDKRPDRRLELLRGIPAVGGHHLAGETLAVMERGNSPINDQVREYLEAEVPFIAFVDIPPNCTLETFNRCSDENYLLISLECWQNIHPALIQVPLALEHRMPYGLIAALHPTKDVADFLLAVSSALE